MGALARLVQTPLGSPLSPETIVVQSRGMSVWVAQELSRRLGIWSNGAFPFPRRFLLNALAGMLGERGRQAEAFERDRMVWTILCILPGLLPERSFARLRRYLEGDDRGIKRFQLTERIAATFDQYVTYRPRMIREWEQGDDSSVVDSDRWQPRLWRAIVDRLGRQHVAALTGEMVTALRDGPPPPGALPARVSLFGIATVPPLYLQALEALSAHVEVHLFLLSPSPRYWADLRTERERAREAARAGLDVEALHLEEGNPLLPSLGRLAADFQQVLEALDYRDGPELYEDPADAVAEPTLLSTIQSDIFHVRRRGSTRTSETAPVEPTASKQRRPQRLRPAGEQLDLFATRAPFQEVPTIPTGETDDLTPPVTLRADDRSVIIHACHTPMREIQVLHDQLLSLLTTPPSPNAAPVRPQDVVVLLPDVEAYAPLVEAVFDRDRLAEGYIPYRIADRPLRHQGPVIEAFHRIVEMVASRRSSTQVLDLLRMEAVRRRFAMSAEELEVLAHWVQESGIRWGIDAADRKRHGQPPLKANTWRFGLERLFLGYAMPGADRTLFQGVLPFDEIEGNGARLLGALAAYTDALFQIATSLQEPRTAAIWQESLGRILDTLVIQDADNAWEHQRIREALADLVEGAEACGYHEPIDLEVMRALLASRMEEREPARGFLSGGVTFCAMLPMRSIPFQVVCVVGLNDGAFPRGRRAYDFDLVARNPRPGDRSKRQDDRYLFLEALLSARQQVLFSYVGQSVRDNTLLPPSVVLGELLDVLDETLAPENAGDLTPARTRLVTRHPMQPFSPRYFDGGDPRLFSYSETYRGGAESLAREAKTFPRLLPTPLPAPEPSAELELSDLSGFFESPVRALLQRRLGLWLRELEVAVEDREPVEIDSLAAWRLGEHLLQLDLDEVPETDWGAVLRATGRLPPGPVGDCYQQAQVEQVRPVATAVRHLTEGGRIPPRTVEVILPGRRLLGQITHRWAAGVLRYRSGRTRPKDLVGRWVEHLAQCADPDDAHTRQTVLVGRAGKGDFVPKVYRFEPLPAGESRDLLADLVELWDVGQREPLLFFAETSMAYARARRDGADEPRAISKARQKWSGGNYPESNDDHIRRLFAGQDPLATGFSPFEHAPLTAGGFTSVARRILDPLLAHLEEP